MSHRDAVVIKTDLEPVERLAAMCRAALNRSGGEDGQGGRAQCI